MPELEKDEGIRLYRDEEPEKGREHRGKKMEWEKKFDELSLKKGKGLWNSGKVTDLKKTESKITATVMARPYYEVLIGLIDGEPVRMKCQCPKCRGRGSCEHLAAVMYAVTGNAYRKERVPDELSDAQVRAVAAKRLEEAAREREAKARLQEEEVKKAAIIEEARLAAEREERRKAEEAAAAAREKAEEAAQAAREKAAREQALTELAERIARREAERKEKKAERKRKKLEALEAQIRAQQEAERKKQEEEQRARQEAEQKAQLEAKRKAEEEQRRREQEEEAARKKAEKIQAAIARKAAEALEQEADRGGAAEAANASKPAKEPDGYCYFDFIKIKKNLGISAANVQKGKMLRKEGKVRLGRVSSGYTDQISGMVAEITATGYEGKREFPVKLAFAREEILQVNCSCSACYGHYWSWYSKERDCPYVSAALEMGQEYIQAHGIGDATDRRAMWLVQSVVSRRANQLMAKMENREESLRLEPKLHAQEGTLRLSFKVGNTKLYVVKDLFEFCEHVRMQETAVYGSSTEINHHPDNFTPDAREWYAFISRVIQEEERLQERMETGMRFSYRASRLSNLELYGWRLDQFFEMLKDRTIEFERRTLQGKEKKRLSGEEKNPEISMFIAPNKSGKNFHGISVSCRLPEFYHGVENAYYVRENSLCRVDREFTEKIEALASAAEGEDLHFQVGRRMLSEFYYSVLPAFGSCVSVTEEGTDEIQKYLPPEVTFCFYLDGYNGNILCRPTAVYGDREFLITDYLKEDEDIVIESLRAQNREQEILFQLQQFFPGYDPAQGTLHCLGEENLMYQVMEHGVDVLMELGEVQCTKRFREMKLIRHVKVAVGVSVSQGMLDLNIETEDISREELLDILKSYRTKQRYYRLKNGDFLKLEDNSLEVLNELMVTLRLTPKEFLKENIHLPAYRALYLDKLLEEHENIYNTRDSHFKKIAKSFKTINDADFEEPESLSHILRGYQRNGFKWLKTLEAYGFGGILADDMGLGKTLQMIAVLLGAKEEGQQGTSLIVCPASLVYNWEEELHRFAPSLSVLAVAGTQEARREKLSGSGAYDVLVTSYDLLKRDIDQYEDKRFLYEVIDEAQYIKNHTTAAAKAVKVIQSAHKFALTGTPIENRLSELWSIFDYLMPGFLYGYDVFKRELETPIAKNGDETALKRLQKMTGPFILRRLKQDVLKDLPDKLEEARYVQLEEAQRRAYDAQVVHMQEQLRMQSGEEFQKNKMQILAELTRLRQICCDPSLCFENYRGESAKLEACLELVESAIDGGHKILLFSQFTSMLEILQKRLEEEKIPFYTITGATDKEKRLQMVKAFNADDTPLFLISLKAGGVGLNLTGADVVIHYDPWWNTAAQDQATDRAHRIGQTKKVTVYKLIARQTVEEKILALQEAKRNLADSIVGAQTGQLSSMSREDLLELLEA